MKEKVILSFRFLFIIFLGSMSLKGQLNENMIAERFNMNAFNPAYVGSEGRQVFWISTIGKIINPWSPCYSLPTRSGGKKHLFPL